jgi:hypothetical protein
MAVLHRAPNLALYREIVVLMVVVAAAMLQCCWSTDLSIMSQRQWVFRIDHRLNNAAVDTSSLTKN